MTPDEMRTHIEAAPLPGDGPGPWEKGAKLGGYNGCAQSLAHAFLVLCDETPSLLDVPSKEDDPSGFERAENRQLWDAFKTRWPEGDTWLGGCTGFQYGWAHNAVRHTLGLGEVGNPAIVTLG